MFALIPKFEQCCQGLVADGWHPLSKVDKLDPSLWIDSMVSGAFRRFDHDHEFRVEGEDTIMVDRFDYTSPLGPLGMIADFLFLESYMRKFLIQRNEIIKKVVDSGRASEFLKRVE